MRKTIKAKISNQTNNSKMEIVEREHQRWKEMMHEIFEKGKSDYQEVRTEDRHSMYASYATSKADSKNHPMPIHNDFMKIERRDTEPFEYWLSIPTKERHGGVYVPLEIPYKYYGFEEEWEIGDSYITKQDGEFYVHIKVEKEVEEQNEYSGVLAVDLGVRHVAVTWNTSRKKPRFHGKELRQVRGKYQYLRKKLQSEKKIEAVKKHKDKEKRKVENQLHNISREIVDEAVEDDLAIFIGDLSGHRESDFGKKGNERLHKAPVYQLKQQIKYKAQEAGVLCKEIDESYTTVTCSSCGYERDSRPGNEFHCPECDYQVNSDVNGAKNIASRGSGYMSESEAVVVQP